MNNSEFLALARENAAAPRSFRNFEAIKQTLIVDDGPPFERTAIKGSDDALALMMFGPEQLLRVAQEHVEQAASVAS